LWTSLEDVATFTCLRYFSISKYFLFDWRKNSIFKKRLFVKGMNMNRYGKVFAFYIELRVAPEDQFS
jgi:hypothetical protein